MSSILLRLRRQRADLLALLALLVLPLLWFLPVLFPALSGVSLLPYDNLYTFEPWRSLRPNLIPHNNLLSDLVLENAVWKLHILRTLGERELPLWNPQILSGIPFLAAGQASTLYPLNVLFYVLPLETAYGWFTALQVALAGINTYIFARTLRLHPLAALLSGVIFMFSGFLIVSVVFTMFLAAVAWLPLLLAVIEFTIQKQEEKGVQSFRPIPYVMVGAATVGLVILAGHPELLYYTLLVAGAYTAVRLVGVWMGGQNAAATPSVGSRFPLSRVLKLGGWLLTLALLGVALGAVQLLPLLELLPLNFREGSASLQQVRGWAWPDRHVLTFFLPDVFGNPSHHAWFDLWRGRWIPATVNALGETNQTIFWGIKNYVEGGNYLGIATWLLAAIAVVHWGIARWRPSTDPPPSAARRYQRNATGFFTGLALISLLFAFGTPLYAILFYGLPGWSQLHSPFRWVFPFTLSMAMLAGVGVQTVAQWTASEPLDGIRLRIRQWANGLLPALALLAGIGALAVVVASYFVPEPFIALGQRIVNGSDLAQMAFADGRMFWGYQSVGLARFGLFAAMSGGLVCGLVWLLGRSGTRRSLSAILCGLLIATVLLDLYAAHGHFNPATPVALSPLGAENVPPAVRFLQDREEGAEPWRFTTFNLPGEKTFNANVGMYYGWQDARGYDSIIPRQYVALMEQIAPQHDELLYNRVAPLYLGESTMGEDAYAALDNPLLDLLNVKYVLTQEYIPNPGWEEIYRDEAVAVYENREVQPRAFIAHEARVAGREEQPLLESNLRETVFIEQTPATPNALNAASPQIATARVSRYTANSVFVDVNLSDRGWLVLSDAYFPGWKAYVRPFGAGENGETELPIYRANGAFRTVYLPEDGQWTVRFVYSPMSFKLGLYTSFLAMMTLLLLLLWWAWGKYYRPESTEGTVRTVAKNSLVPMGLNLANKAIDFAFAMLYVRLLGPTGTGQYYFVVSLYGLFEILSRYGLGTLLTRDVAADKNQSSRYLTNVIVLRTLLWLVSLPVLALVTYGFRVVGSVNPEVQSIGVQEMQALGLLAIAMLFANWSDALSNMFNAFEKMEYPAGLASAVSLLKVTLGALVLLLGWGFVGLAAVSLVINIAQLLWMISLLRNTLFRPQWHLDWPLQRWMLHTSGPLMINHLLATIFWRIDIAILRPVAGATSVGFYSVGIKYLDGLNIIPSMFTMAVFPLMSRYARADERNLLRSYTISVRLLLMISLPIALAFTFLAEPLAWVVGGAQFINRPETVHLFGRSYTFLGGADLAIQVIMWSIPIGFINSVTQFVLIAVNQQRYLTKAFVIGVVFNTVGNLLLIPRFGYLGAAFVTILSEFSLLFPFYYSVRRNVGVVPWRSICTAPLLSIALAGLAVYGMLEVGINVWGAVGLGWIAYAIALVLTGAFRHEDMAVVWRALPLKPFQRGRTLAENSTES